MDSDGDGMPTNKPPPHTCVLSDRNKRTQKKQLIRPFYLSAFLAQLQSDGYSVFVVRGVRVVRCS